MIVQNKGSFIRHIGNVMIIPGTNSLSEAQTKAFEGAIESNPLDKALIGKEIVLPEVKGASVNSVSDMKADEALVLIADTFDLTLLSQWAEDEQKTKPKPRKSVEKAIEEQIESIKNPPEDTVVNTEE